jgi:hypothetical protein
LLSFVYLVVRSVLRIVVWSLRSRDTQALEVMVLRHQLEVLNRRSVALASTPTTACCSPPLPTGLKSSLACLLGAPRDTSALAPPSGHAQSGGVGEQESRTAPYPTGPQEPDRPLRQGQPALGLQAHPRRAQETRSRDLGNDDPRRPAPLGSRTRAEEGGSKLVGSFTPRPRPSWRATSSRSTEPGAGRSTSCLRSSSRVAGFTSPAAPHVLPTRGLPSRREISR